MSIIWIGHLLATYAFPASREKKLLNPDKIPQKTPQIPRDLWFFIFTHLSLAHSELAPVWLSCYPEIIPILSTKNPVSSFFRHKKMLFIPKTPQFLLNFCGFFGIWRIFVDFSRSREGFVSHIWSYFLYILLYYILYIYLFISYIFFVFNNILK